MPYHIKPKQRKRPDKLILHIGTNSLKSRETSTKHAEDIISLAESVKNALPETELIISGLITRVDNGDLANKVNQVNKILKEKCLQRHWKLIGHPNITSNHLIRSGIYLNKIGTAMLSCNFNKYIHNKNESNNIELKHTDGDDQIVEGFGESNATYFNISTSPFPGGMVMTC